LSFRSAAEESASVVSGRSTLLSPTILNFIAVFCGAVDNASITKRSDEMPTTVWYVIFLLPVTAIIGAWVWIATNFRQDMRHLSMWPATILTAISGLWGVWGFIHINQLSQRNGFDYGFESDALGIAFIGGIFSILWQFRTKSKPSKLALSASIWTFCVWLLICSTI